MKTGLPSLEDRIAQRNASTIAKMFLSDRLNDKKESARGAIKAPEAQTPSSYGKDHSNNIKSQELDDDIMQLCPDSGQGAQHIPPWKREVATFRYTKLPRAKDDCTMEELKNAAQAAIQIAETAGAQAYYTDGTIDPGTQTTGDAVFSSNLTACWRSSNNASNMQRELIAIKHALYHYIENEEGPVVIYTDSRSSMQTLQQEKNKENKALLADIKTLIYQHNERSRPVTLNWIPSYIGIPGNEKIDELAKAQDT
ncbi:uncharacterized protein [Palaemon carinicauda]|uniref:uncharacterized protein n=1 Tax=Palaemon carinicauda TaxID=392227 RepID=UPI0035B57251